MEIPKLDAHTYAHILHARLTRAQTWMILAFLLDLFLVALFIPLQEMLNYDERGSLAFATGLAILWINLFALYQAYTSVDAIGELARLEAPLVGSPRITEGRLYFFIIAHLGPAAVALIAPWLLRHVAGSGRGAAWLLFLAAVAMNFTFFTWLARQQPRTSEYPTTENPNEGTQTSDTE